MQGADIARFVHSRPTMSGLVPADNGLAGQPSSSFTCPLLTDMYQITMAYAYWRAGKADEPAVRAAVAAAARAAAGVRRLARRAPRRARRA